MLNSLETIQSTTVTALLNGVFHYPKQYGTPGVQPSAEPRQQKPARLFPKTAGIFMIAVF